MTVMLSPSPYSLPHSAINVKEIIVRNRIIPTNRISMMSPSLNKKPEDAYLWLHSLILTLRI